MGCSQCLLRQGTAEDDPVSLKDLAARTATPEAAFRTYATALKEGNWKLAYRLMTPAYQDYQVFEAAFRLGLVGKEDLIEKHQDPKKLERLQAKEEKRVKEAIANAEKEEPDRKDREAKQHEARREIVDSFINKEAFYAAAMEAMADDLREHFPDGKLQNLSTEANRARGTRTSYLMSLEKTKDGKQTERRTAYETPVYFRKTEHGWRLDAPTQVEARGDIERINPAFRQALGRP